MKNLMKIGAGLCCLLLLSCTQSGSGLLFDGKDSKQWITSGQTEVNEGVLNLSGAGAQAILKWSVQGFYAQFGTSYNGRRKGRYPVSLRSGFKQRLFSGYQ